MSRLSSWLSSCSNQRKDGIEIFERAYRLTKNVAYFVPRNTDGAALAKLAGQGNRVEIEQNILNWKTKTITAYYGKG